MSQRPAPAIQWQLLPFAALSGAQVYEVLQLRSEVFVVEQNCVFLDMDGADDQALHLLGLQDGALVAYARLFQAGIKFAEASIGRVVTHSRVRGSGVGHLLIQHAVSSLWSAWGIQPIRIGAQAHLKDYYGRHGFVDAGVPYVEDGIDHIEMLRHAAPTV